MRSPSSAMLTRIEAILELIEQGGRASMSEIHAMLRQRKLMPKGGSIADLLCDNASIFKFEANGHWTAA